MDADAPVFDLRQMVLTVYLPSTLAAFVFGAMVPLLPVFARDELGLPFGLVGLVVAAEGLGMLAGDLPAGALLRRLGKKNTMLIGALAFAVGAAGLIAFPGVWLLIGLRILTGIGNSFFSLGRHAYLAEMVPNERRGRAIGLLGGIFRFGRLTGPAAGGIVAAQLGYQAAFVMLTAVAVLIPLVVLLFVRRTHQLVGRPDAPHVPLLRVAWRHWRVLGAAGIGQLFAQGVRTGRFALLPLYAAEILGLDVQTIGFIESLGAAVDMALFYPAGLIMDRWGRKAAIVPNFLLQGVALATLPLVGSAGGLTVLAAVLGVGNGLTAGTMMTLGADLAPEDERGEFLGIWRLIGDVGGTAGPMVMGAVAQVLVLSSAALVVGASGVLAALIFGLLMPETLQKRARQVSP